MSDVLIPAKTPLGQAELRSRSHGLSQRHRTVLLLTDGARPLGEVLRMALQAGAETNHFEELLRLGLIEMPARSPGYEAVETVPDLSIAPPTTPMELDASGEEPPEVVEVVLPVAQAELQEVAFEELAQGAAASPQAPASAEVQSLAEPESAPQPLVEPSVVAAPQVSAPPAAIAKVRYQEPALGLSLTPRVPEWKGPERRGAPRADHARPAPKLTDDERLKIVRNLLMDVLRNDNLLFSTFSVARVRNAQTQREMINLIWEIERDRIHIRRNREQLGTLQRARELLGMGNTHVAGDSQPPPMASDF